MKVHSDGQARPREKQQQDSAPPMYTLCTVYKRIKETNATAHNVVHVSDFPSKDDAHTCRFQMPDTPADTPSSATHNNKNVMGIIPFLPVDLLAMQSAYQLLLIPLSLLSIFS